MQLIACRQGLALHAGKWWSSFLKTLLVMKLIVVLLLATCMQISAKGIAQNISLSENNAPLKKVLKEVKRQTGYAVFYEDRILQKGRAITIMIRDKPLEQALRIIFQDQPLTFEIIGNKMIVVKEKETAMRAPVAITAPVAIRVSGEVRDAEGQPLGGASISIKNGASTLSDMQGKYSLEVPDTKTVLIFSYVGYITQNIPVGDKTAINVTMVKVESSMENVVVVGYGSRRKGDVTGSTASMDAQTVREVPTTNVSQALQGRIPGLVSTPSSFRPGSGSSIRIRGNRSLTAGNDPLVVLDGVPISYSLDDINPLDIESIDVLKDASATAIYGSRGANGVIQITTKKGKNGRMSIDYDGKVSFDNILVPLDVFSAAEFAQLKRDAYIGSRTYNPALSNAAAAPKLYYPDPATDYTLFNNRGDYYTWQSVASGYTWRDAANRIAAKRALSAEEKALLVNMGFTPQDSVAIYDPNKVQGYDWQQHGLQTGITNNHNISITGGSDKFRASFSGGYFNQKGIEQGQDYTRFSFSLNADFKPVNWVNFGGGILYSNAIQNQGPSVYTSSSYQLPIARPYDSTGTLIFFPGNDANIVNPINDVNTIFNETRINRAIPNAFGEVTLLKGLKFRAAANIDMSDTRQGVFNGSVSSSRAGNPANANYRTRYYFTWTAQNYLTYDRKIGEKHNINALAGQEWVKSRFEENYNAAENLIYESQKWYSLQNNTTGALSTYTGTFTQTQQWSYFGRLNYGYNDKYLLTLTMRDDWASVLPAGKKHLFFPSGALAWKIDQEPFIQNIALINQLKLRAGYGAVGNISSITPYLANGSLARSPYNFGDIPAQGYAPATLPLDISWEKTTSKNLGLDFSLLQNRISGSVDLYETNTNQIQNKRLPAANGIANILVNLGEVRNRGIEVNLNTVNISKGDWRWTTDFVFAVNKEEVTDLGIGGSDIANQWFIGQPLSVYYDYQFKGIFQYSDTVKGGILADYFWKKPGNKTNANLQPGRVYVADLNGDTVLTEADKIVLGSHNPKWTASVNSTVSWKNFELRVFAYFRRGSLLREIRPSLNGRYQSFHMNYWTPTNPSNEYPQANNTIDIYQYWQASGFRDASFVRIRNISLTYRFSKQLLERIHTSNASVYVNVLNPFLFSKYKTADPETTPYLSSYPTSSTTAPGPNSLNYRSVVVGVRVGL